MADALDFRAFEPFEEKPDHVQADSGTSLLDFSDGKKSGLGVNGGFDEGGLGPARRFDLSGAILQLGVAAPDDGAQEIHIHGVNSCLPSCQRWELRLRHS
jgi:hypothetical protein